MEPQALVVTRDFYETLMGLPDGADVSEYFESDDPTWNVMTLKLLKTSRDEMSLWCECVIDVEPEPDVPPGATPGAAAESR
jgi:hypothetical protein